MREAIPPLAPKPAGVGARALWRYAGIARMGDGAHPLDWQRFYQFVKTAHTVRLGWDAGEVSRRLQDYGIQRERARYLADIYWHARCIPYVGRRSREPRAEYYGWMGKHGTRLC